MIEEAILQFVSQEGIFAALFLWLLWKTTKDAKEREERLYAFLSEMKEEFARLGSHYERLADDMEDVKGELQKRYKDKE